MFRATKYHAGCGGGVDHHIVAPGGDVACVAAFKVIGGFSPACLGRPVDCGTDGVACLPML